VLVFAAGLLCDAPLATAQVVQQVSKLVGSGSIGDSQQGFSVALSADGKTAIVGGPCDNIATASCNSAVAGPAGAVWVFTQSGGMWTQQQKLVGTGAFGGASQGYGVALSADGNTVIVGGPCDTAPIAQCSGSPIGATWVFTRSAGLWTQQGPK